MHYGSLYDKLILWFCCSDDEHEEEMMIGEDDEVEEAITDSADEVQLDSPYSSNTD